MKSDSSKKRSYVFRGDGEVGFVWDVGDIVSDHLVDVVVVVSSDIIMIFFAGEEFHHADRCGSLSFRSS